MSNNFVEQGKQASLSMLEQRQRIIAFAEEKGYQVDTSQDEMVIRVPRELSIKERTSLIEALQSKQSLG